uniref:Integrase catalytic domain-containing protein n=1 Tax=Meloidogyne enterolobii TaxID=390850 RepID=A0A6V7W864_MELEN|nr:unnamed protein product [Meloidogyne enterolobii]
MNKDALMVKLNKIEDEKIWTKRKVLKGIAKTFDPLGLIAPVNFKRKLFVQELWKNQNGWDDKIDEINTEKWKEIKNDFGSFCVRRQSIFKQKAVELHVFVDASSKGFASVAYLKGEQEKGETNTSIIFAKSRLAPLKNQMTIPRLELMGAVAGKRMTEFIKKESDIEIVNYFIWSDSKCILSWILLSNEEKLPRFVKKRILDLRENKSINWRYVPTGKNPADLATRGCNCEELKCNKMWWEGPDFLKKNKKEWPPMVELEPKEKENIEEIKIDILVGEVINLEIRNEYPKLVNISKKVCVALKKFVKKVKVNTEFMKEIKHTETSLGIKKLAEYLIILQSQHKDPPTEKEIKELMMKKEKYGIWTCLGRLENSTSKNPIFVSYNSPLANLMSFEAHLKTFHSGVRQSLVELRNDVWIPAGRRKMRAVIDKCFECRRLKLKPFEIPNMPNLPVERVNKSKPFENCGVDYAGPFEVKNKEGLINKCWIEIFTCMSTRFTHLEIVQDLSAKSCIMAFRRFIAEYGLPKRIISDNGTQYQLTSKIVLEIQKKLETKNINWIFIPSLSPWFGGFYECMVKIMKKCLKSSIGRKLLFFEELRTILIEVKQIMNTRPLMCMKILKILMKL